MTILDEPERCSAIDPRSMYSLLEGFPEQIAASMKIGDSISITKPGRVAALVVAGLGGSAIGGDLARSIAGSRLKTPFVVSRDYDLPGFVDASSLVIACSYSGNTEETLSAYRQARQAKASIVCITSGGELADMAKVDGVATLPLPPGLPPRAALGHSLAMLLTALQKLRLVPDLSAALDEAVALLRRLRDRYAMASVEAENPAKRLAVSLHGRIAAVYGSSAAMDSVAFRWRCQIEENAKNLAFHHMLPEMNHNELVGWMHPQEVLKQVAVVLLRDEGDHPQVQRRFDLIRDIITAKAGALHEVWSEGESLPARVLSSIYLGDFVSLYMAYLNRTDPTPVEVIDFLKKQLAASV